MRKPTTEFRFFSLKPQVSSRLSTPWSLLPYYVLYIYTAVWLSRDSWLDFRPFVCVTLQFTIEITGRFVGRCAIKKFHSQLIKSEITRVPFVRHLNSAKISISSPPVKLKIA